MTTHILNTNNDLRGTLVRLHHGEPVVRYFGDSTEYLPGWRHLEVTSSAEYLLPPGRFDDELFTDAVGDVWRRKARTEWGPLWPCQENQEHLFNGKGTRCWHCDQVADHELSYEVFTLVSAEGFPAESARPQTRSDVEEWTGGPLLRVGSPEARERAAGEVASSPTPGEGCGPIGYAFVVLSLMVAVLVIVAAVRLIF